jgi:hypothetical protein
MAIHYSTNENLETVDGAISGDYLGSSIVHFYFSFAIDAHDTYLLFTIQLHSSSIFFNPTIHVFWRIDFGTLLTIIAVSCDQSISIQHAQ